MNKEINLLDLLIIFAENKIKIVVSGIIVGVLTFVGVSFLPKHYKSEVVFLPKGNQTSSIMSIVGVSGVGDFVGENPFSKRQYLEILNSRSLAEATIEKFDLITYYKQRKNKINPLDKTIKLLKKDIKITMEEEGGLGITDVLSITLSVSNENPQKAADIANFVVEKMIERSREIYAESFVGAIEYLDRQIEDNSLKSREAALELENFQKEHNLYNVQTQINLSLSTYVSNLSEISAIEKQIETLKLTQFSSNEMSILRNQMSRLKAQNEQIETVGYGTVLPGLGNVINLSDKYTQLYINSKMLEQLQILFLQQRLQVQIKMERDYSTVYVIDDARPAEYKYKPKRIKYCAIVLALWYMYFIPSILLKSILRNSYQDDPTIQKFSELKNALSFKKRY
ncbi:MAG: Wzz/FepE/Etk N-terminal domain-containing protein [Chitinivibrionia bacterium]|nr:Wzz/FepE/Etk N-terminal domain-containing protein [Chitinivibrionia bacterium]